MNNYIKYKNRELILMDAINDVENTWEHLQPGFYEAGSMGGLFSKQILTFKELQLADTLIQFKSGVFGEVNQAIDKFLSKETIEKYNYLETTHKMGMILYGPPGTGKTCLAYLCMQDAIKNHNALCFDCTGDGVGFIQMIIQAVRKVQDNLIILFVDEVETELSRNEHAYLPFLDGVDSVKGCIFLGCTNYLEKIPKRIVERKSRIKHTFEVKTLPDEVYKQYIKAKLKNISDRKLAKYAFIAAEAQLSIDELKTAVIDHYIEEIPFVNAIEQARKYNKQEMWDVEKKTTPEEEEEEDDDFNNDL
jgi:replication-associated recombination protein RarA